MASRTPSSRTTGLAAAATSVMALVAVTAVAAAVPTVRAVSLERRVTLSESEAVRVMAMAVAGLACDLLGGERTLVAMASPRATLALAPVSTPGRIPVPHESPAGVMRLRESLLDLPPPRI